MGQAGTGMLGFGLGINWTGEPRRGQPEVAMGQACLAEGQAGTGMLGSGNARSNCACPRWPPVRERALGQLSLLSAVAKHKQIFFTQAWAKYELAKPGTIRLVPPPERLGALERDYAAMRQMMFGAPPSFGAILEGLSELESRINGQSSR